MSYTSGIPSDHGPTVLPALLPQSIFTKDVLRVLPIGDALAFLIG